MGHFDFLSHDYDFLSHDYDFLSHDYDFQNGFLKACFFFMA